MSLEGNKNKLQLIKCVKQFRLVRTKLKGTPIKQSTQQFIHKGSSNKNSHWRFSFILGVFRVLIDKDRMLGNKRQGEDLISSFHNLQLKDSN